MVMPPKQRTKAELRHVIKELTERLQAAEAHLDTDVEAERDEALARAEQAEQRTLHLEHQVNQLKKDLEGAQGHVLSEVEIKKKLEKAEFDLKGSKENVHQLEIELDDARDEVDHLEWKLESAKRDAELQAARVKERAQADHKKELEARDEIITLLKEKLSRLSGHKAGEAEAPPRSMGA